MPLLLSSDVVNLCHPKWRCASRIQGQVTAAWAKSKAEMKGSEEGALVSIKIWTLAGGDCGDASKTTGSSVFHSVTFRFRRNDVPAMQLRRGMSCPFVMFALPASKHFESFSWVSTGSRASAQERVDLGAAILGYPRSHALLLS